MVAVWSWPVDAEHRHPRSARPSATATRPPARHRARASASPSRGRPAQGPAPGRRRSREFRVDERSSGYEVGQTARASATCSPRASSSTSPASRRARASRATSSATTSSAARRPTARTTTASPARSAPARRPGRVYKGIRMAGHMGDERVTIKKLRVVRADAERTCCCVKGSRARRARRADPREEGLTLPQTTLYDKTGAASAASSCPTSSSPPRSTSPCSTRS